MSSTSNKKPGIFNKFAPKRKMNTHISQYYKKGGDRRDSESSTDKRHRDHPGPWTAFKNIFSPLSFQTYRDNRKNRRPKQSKDMVMYHHLACAALEDPEEVAVDLSEKEGDTKKGDGAEKAINREGNDINDGNGEWSTFTHSNTETNV